MMRSGLTGALLLVFLALVAVVGAEVKLGTVRPATGGAAPSAVAPPAVETEPARFTLPPLASLKETVARPLFSEHRRRPEPAPASVATAPATPARPAAPEVGPFVVTAIVIDEVGRVALLEVPGSGKIERVRQGQSVAGWKVVRIDPDTVTLTRGEKEREVVLRRFVPVPVAAQKRPRSRNVVRRKLTRSSARVPPSARSRSRARAPAPPPRKSEEDCGLSRC